MPNNFKNLFKKMNKKNTLMFIILFSLLAVIFFDFFLYQLIIKIELIKEIEKVMSDPDVVVSDREVPTPPSRETAIVFGFFNKLFLVVFSWLFGK